MDELKRAIEAAGRELESQHSWLLDGDPAPCPDVLATEFGQVLMKHLAPVVALADPDHTKIMRQARIAALYAELQVLESNGG